MQETLLVFTVLHFTLLSFSSLCQKLRSIFPLSPRSGFSLPWKSDPFSRKKSSFSLSSALSLVCRAAIGDNALRFYQVWTCQEHSAVTELTAMENYVVGLWYMLVPLIRLNAAEDFQWTKNNPGSFYYGTFPAGTVEQQLTGGFIMLEMYLWVCARKGPTGFLVLPGKWQKHSGSYRMCAQHHLLSLALQIQGCTEPCASCSHVNQ